MCETEPLCAENIGLKDILRSRRGELISRGELMYYSSISHFLVICKASFDFTSISHNLVDAGTE